MSLFQCEVCGCCENTALTGANMCQDFAEKWFRWEGHEDKRGKKLCSACGPTKFKEGDLSGLGKWHGKFDRIYLPMGEFKTNQVGNLEHIKTGSEDFRCFRLDQKERS